MLGFKEHLIGQSAKNDILSGLVVAVALVPEAIAFSFIAQVSPIVGLYAAFILGLITAIMGGKPGMISGATGAVAIVFVGLSIKASEQLSNAGVSGSAMSDGILQYILDDGVFPVNQVLLFYYHQYNYQAPPQLQNHPCNLAPKQ